MPDDLAATGETTAPPPAATHSLRRRIIIGAAIVFVGAWAIALTYSVTAGGRSPERLDNEQAAVAEKACRTAQRDMTALPAVDERSTAAARADRIAGEDAVLQTMVDEIRKLRPDSEAPRIALNAWLDDWQKLIDARENFAHDVRTLGRRARFVEPAAVGIQPIADKMNDWILEQGTRTNDCNTGRLQAEVIDGPRVYGKESNS